MKILFLGDSPYVNTGFGVVNRQALRAVEPFHEVYILGAQDSQARGDRFFPTTADDLMGWSHVKEVLNRVQPDALHIIADPATVMAWLLHDEVAALPIVIYMPIEGAPFNPYWRQVMERRGVSEVITCSQYGVDVLRDNGIHAKLAYHGVSDDFHQYTPEKRAEMRESVGWTDEFVVLGVAQNVGRKQWPRLLEGVKIAHKSDSRVRLYAHTVPFNYFHLGGHDLVLIARELGIEDIVYFNPTDMDKHLNSVPLVGTGRPGLVDYYNMADCFVLPSQVEGFGLPLAEAMKCGLPVAHTDYAAGAEVIGDAGIHLPVLEYVWDKSQARYASVAPNDIANAILKMRNPEVRKKMVAKGLERAKAFDWADYQRLVREAFDAIALQKTSQVDTTAAETA